MEDAIMRFSDIAYDYIEVEEKLQALKDAVEKASMEVRTLTVQIKRFLWDAGGPVSSKDHLFRLEGHDTLVVEPLKNGYSLYIADTETNSDLDTAQAESDLERPVYEND
jgi:hypothetical protein